MAIHLTVLRDAMTRTEDADPIFARIEAVNAAIAWQAQLFKELCRGVHFLDGDSASNIQPEWVPTIRMSDQIVNEAIHELLTTAPTTLQGVVKILDYLGSGDPDMNETRLSEFADSNVRDAVMRLPKLLSETIQRLIMAPSNWSERRSSIRVRAIAASLAD
jgi:hypothetical protein